MYTEVNGRQQMYYIYCKSKDEFTANQIFEGVVKDRPLSRIRLIDSNGTVIKDTSIKEYNNETKN